MIRFDFVHALVLLIAGAGITNILVYGFIFSSVRRWVSEARRCIMFPYVVELVNCSMCMGFWVGALLEACFKASLITSSPSWFYKALSIFVAGSCVSWCAQASDKLLGRNNL